ncbi:hypothetical protein F2Y83_12580 [Bacteroides cellulosilyticus]|nr:hypothetical protein F2Y70_03410 [Bacteroides cellulosilyticus]KAA5435416.1 hypothetical protein F2Y83_12580 [Bacteroides cellulosilyticus]KAA5436621.1 hypothetical protein F2Y74_13860 [Bacteroides cellulosilyticus]KAA5458210.1 hypothetical protein F2Y53_08140 [Bacteroides cellulosilyticus]
MLERIWADRNNIQPALSLYPLAPYPNRIRTVLAPYILRPEVPLYGASTARVRYKYSPNTKLTRFLHLNFPRIKPFGTMFIINEINNEQGVENFSESF